MLALLYLLCVNAFNATCSLQSWVFSALGSHGHAMPEAGWGFATPLPAKMGSNLEASWKLDCLLRATELQPDLKPACLGALGGLNF